MTSFGTILDNLRPKAAQMLKMVSFGTILDHFGLMAPNGGSSCSWLKHFSLLSSHFCTTLLQVHLVADMFGATQKASEKTGATPPPKQTRMGDDENFEDAAEGGGNGEDGFVPQPFLEDRPRTPVSAGASSGGVTLETIEHIM